MSRIPGFLGECSGRTQGCSRDWSRSLCSDTNKSVPLSSSILWGLALAAGFRLGPELCSVRHYVSPTAGPCLSRAPYPVLRGLRDFPLAVGTGTVRSPVGALDTVLQSCWWPSPSVGCADQCYAQCPRRSFRRPLCVPFSQALAPFSSPDS